jgi:hypothetical protein
MYDTLFEGHMRAHAHIRRAPWMQLTHACTQAHTLVPCLQRKTNKPLP